MSHLMSRYSAYVLLAAGLVLIGLGYSKGAAPVDTQPTSTSIVEIESNGLPAGKPWLKVADGQIFWGAKAKITRANGVTGWCAPLVSEGSAKTLLASTANEFAKPDFGRVRLLVFIPEATLKSRLPNWTESTNSSADAFPCEGVVESLATAGPEFKKYRDGLVTNVANVDVNKLVVFTEGAKPAPTGGVTFWYIGGGVAVALGLTSLVLSRRQQSPPAEPPSGGALKAKPVAAIAADESLPPIAGYAPPKSGPSDR